MTPLDARRRGRMTWAVVALALLAYVCLGLAEQGARASELRVPPPAPLPFPRDTAFGLDLRDRTSLEALDWLNRAGGAPLPLVLLPIDADVVAALSQEPQRAQGLAAVDALVQASHAPRLALCLRKPPGAVGQLAIAQATVGLLRERFASTIVYTSACDAEDDPEWQASVARATRGDDITEAQRPALIPVSVGTNLPLRALDGERDLRSGQLVPAARGSYTLYTVPLTAPVSPELATETIEALRETAHAALVLARPSAEVDPAAFVASLASATAAPQPAAEGFTSVTSPAVTLGEGWSVSTVATTAYARATADGAPMAVDFIGTDLYLVGVQSPDGGTLQVWIDTDPVSGASPDAEVTLEAAQAEDVAVAVQIGLPAARHRAILVSRLAEGQGLSISGFFVAGRPAPVWAGTLASASLLLIATLGIAERSYSAITHIRDRSRLPAQRLTRGHPRVFGRER